MRSTSLAQRSTSLERLDSEPFGFDEFQAYLQVLERINGWTLAYRPTLSWLQQVLVGMGQAHPVSILDVGSGSGDMLRTVWKWGQSQGVALDLAGIDINPSAKMAAELATPSEAPIRFETADVFDFVPARPVDFIICSLFTHHLTDHENVRFLQWLDDHARHGWFINDLHRNLVPYLFMKHTPLLYGRNPAVRHDAPLSIARAFTAADWRRFLAAARIPASGTRIQWFFPFRYGVARWKRSGL